MKLVTVKLEAKATKVRAKQGQMRQFRGTYIVQVRLHVDQSQRFLKEDNEHSAGNPVLIKAVFVHVRLLREDERRVFKAYRDAQIESDWRLPRGGFSGRELARLALRKRTF